MEPEIEFANIKGDAYDTQWEEEFVMDEMEFANIEGDAHDTEWEEEIYEEIVIDGTGSEAIKQKRRHMTDEQKRVVFLVLLWKSVDGKLKRTTTTEIATAFSIGIRTIQRIWKQGRESPTGDVSNKRSNCGRKPFQLNNDQVLQVPLRKRTTIYFIACQLEVSASVIYRLLRRGALKRHSNTIKPLVTEAHKISRLKFCLSMLEQTSLSSKLFFKDMFNMVHIDEKWFFMTKRKENYYLLPDEKEPLRTCKSKNFIGKVMFLAVVARPRFDVNGTELFSGKIGIHAFVTREPAKRRSANRAAGTMETKPINSVKREHSKSFLIEKILLAIKEKWPAEDREYPIFIQQDNARTHVNPKDYEFCEAAKKDGFDIRLICQPANSPDLNILDLGFFNAIQALQYKESPTTVDELVNSVLKSFDEFSVEKSNRIFLTLQQCMIEIIKGKGGHDYKLQHLNKAKLEREGKLPIQLECEVDLAQEVEQLLS